MRDAELTAILTRRALVIGGAEAVLVMVLLARLYQFQVSQNSKYKKLSDQNALRLKILPPQRGVIADKNGVEMAKNRSVYEILMIPEEVLSRGKTVDEILGRISLLVPISQKEHDKIMSDISKKRPFFPVVVKNYLSWDDMAKIQLVNLELPGVSVEEGKQRSYPMGEVSSHAVGYVAAVAEEEVKGASVYELSLPDSKIGKTGVEKAHEGELRGKSGEEIQVVNAVGRVIETLETRRKAAVPGRNVRLTVDNRLQEYAYQRISHESASAVMMDVLTGDVLLMISVPGFNPNIFQNDINAPEKFAEYLANPYKPLLNKSIEGLYPPGSTFKPVTLMAALASGKATPGTRHMCAGHWHYGGRDWHCWNAGGHGMVDLIGSLKYSCDVYYYNIGAKINMDVIQETAYKFGFGSPTGVGLPGEKGGQVPSRTWKKNYRSEAWYTGDTIAASIGQGHILATPMQLAMYAARIASGGLAVVPRIVRGDNDDPKFPEMDVSQDDLKLVQRGMFDVVNRPEGTGKYALIERHGRELCGKTGTSQVRQFTAEEKKYGVDQTLWPWETRSHALFIGYAPYRNPRYAVSVVIEHGIAGGANAGPIARDLMLKAMELGGL